MRSLRTAGCSTLLAAGGLAVGLLAAELLVRATSLAPSIPTGFGTFVADGSLPFIPSPLSHDSGSTAEFRYDYRHNSIGFRDSEHALAKVAGTVRVLGLGDSFTYGVGAAFDESYLARLESMLAGRPGTHAKVEVIKAGIPRYFPEAERALLERYGLQFRPDVIVVGVLPNDVVDTHFGMDAVTVDTSGYLKTREAKQLGAWGARLYRSSHLGRLVLRAYMNRSLRIPPDREIYRSGGPFEADWLTMEREYSRMAQLADSIGARLVLVHIPQRGPWGPESDYLPARLSQWAGAHGAQFLDVLPVMRRAPNPGQLYYPADGHCTPAGYAVVADALFEYLMRERLLP